MRAPVVIVAATLAVMLLGVTAQGSSSGSGNPPPPPPTPGSGSGPSGSGPSGSGPSGSAPGSSSSGSSGSSGSASQPHGSSGSGQGSGNGNQQGSGNGSNGGANGGNGTTSNYPSPSYAPQPSYTPGPTPYLDPCAQAALKVTQCHRLGPFGVDPTFVGPIWTVPDLKQINPYNPCCQHVSEMLYTCYFGLDGLLYDWFAFSGATVDKSVVLEAYLTSCPTGPRSNCVNATLDIAACVESNRDIVSGGGQLSDTANCCDVAANIGTTCQGWNSLEEGQYGNILTVIPPDVYTEVDTLLKTCPVFSNKTCEAAVGRVTSCMVNYGGLTPYDYGDANSQPQWAENSYPYTPCCQLVPLVHELCQGYNVTDVIYRNTVGTTATTGTGTMTSTQPRRRFDAVDGLINRCTPIPGTGDRVVTQCDDAIYGVHIWNGQLISLQCKSWYAQSHGCTPIYINSKAYYVVRPDVPEGFVERTECAAVPI